MPAGDGMLARVSSGGAAGAGWKLRGSPAALDQSQYGPESRGVNPEQAWFRTPEAGRARSKCGDLTCSRPVHTGSDGSSVRDRVEAQGYSWSWIGENFYVTSNTTNGAQVAFDWWMNSTPHRNNLLSPNYTQFGVGYIYDAESDHGGYFVVVFARPG